RRRLGHVPRPARLQPARPGRAERRTTAALKPGPTTLPDGRAVADGAAARLDPAALPAIETSARTVEAIVAKGEPVYGINTGFGKLASVHIPPADLATLQRNIVLSHAAGVGEPMRPANVRLMMALKLASLGRGPRAAGNGRPARGHAGARRDPGDPQPRVGRRIGGPRPPRPSRCRHARDRRCATGRRDHAGGGRAGAGRACAYRAWPQGRAR